MATPPDPLEKLLSKYDARAAEMEEARSVGRDVIYRIVVLSAGIVGFSATLLSIENLDLNVDTGLHRLGWILFAIVVFVGAISVLLRVAGAVRSHLEEAARLACRALTRNPWRERIPRLSRVHSFPRR